eukprot:1670470-Rhodomonas_salina.1
MPLNPPFFLSLPLSSPLLPPSRLALPLSDESSCVLCVGPVGAVAVVQRDRLDGGGGGGQCSLHTDQAQRVQLQSK